MTISRHYVLAAGGTGGHLIPAFALGQELINRGHHVALITDERGAKIPGCPDKMATHKLPAGRITKNLSSWLPGLKAIADGRAMARRLYEDFAPSAVVGFGGYPTIPALGAAWLLRRPRMIHEQNGVLGRVNEIFAKRVDRVACGTWPTDLPAGLKEALRRSLYWHGFGQLGANVFVHPSAEWRVVFDALTLEGFQHLLPGMLAFSALHPGAGLGGTNRDVVRTAWDLKQLGDDYDAFIKRYAPVADELTGPGGAAGVDPETAFQVRVLLIHDFRRLLLRDPQLPEALLPTHWPGLRARAMCQAIYRQLWPASESHLAGTLRLANGSELKVGAEVPANMASWLL